MIYVLWGPLFLYGFGFLVILGSVVGGTWTKESGDDSRPTVDSNGCLS